VHARAVLRTVTNVAIAVGSGIGALALLARHCRRVPLAHRRRRRHVPRRRDAAREAAPSGRRARCTRRPDDASRSAGARRMPRLAAPASHTPPGATPATSDSPRSARSSACSSASARSACRSGSRTTRRARGVVAVVLILNTVIVVMFQVPLSRGTHDLRRAGRVLGDRGVAHGGRVPRVRRRSRDCRRLRDRRDRRSPRSRTRSPKCSRRPAAGGLSFELADPVAPRAPTRAVFSMGYSLGAMVAPLFVTSTALTLGLGGWGDPRARCSSRRASAPGRSPGSGGAHRQTPVA
jgi:hypothetical protein